jgi:hypothetical protein
MAKFVCHRLSYMQGDSPVYWFMQDNSYSNNLALKLVRHKICPITIISISGYTSPSWYFLAEVIG